MSNPINVPPNTCPKCMRPRGAFVGAPEDPDAERAVVGSLFRANAFHDVQTIVTSEDFAVTTLRTIYEAQAALAMRGDPIDTQTLSEMLKSWGSFDIVGGLDKLRLLEANAPLGGNVARYAQRVKELSIRRRLMLAAQGMIESAQDPNQPLAEVLESADRDLFGVSQGNLSESEMPSFKATLVERFKALLQRAKNPGDVEGVPTGFVDLDKRMGGMRGGQLVVIAGRPGHRKSLLAMQIARNVADKVGPVAFFSLEMRRGEIVDRMIAAESRVSYARFQEGRIGAPGMREQLDAGAGALLEIGNRSDIHIFDRSGVTTAFMHARCRQLAAVKDKPLALAILDYAQLMDGEAHSRAAAQSREREVARISRACKMLSMDLNIPILILSQCNRKSTERENPRPQLADMRESGAIEQDADSVLGVYCAEKDDPSSPDANIMEVIVLKQRNGRTGTIGLALFAEEMRLADLAKGTVFGLERESRDREAQQARGNRR